MLEWGVAAALAGVSLYRLLWDADQSGGVLATDSVLFGLVAAPYALNTAIRLALYLDAFFLNRAPGKALNPQRLRVQRWQFYTRTFSVSAALLLLIQGLSALGATGAAFPDAMQGLSTGLAVVSLVLGLYSLGIDGLGGVFDDRNWPLCAAAFGGFEPRVED